MNALVWRLHEQGLPKKKRVASSAELSISKGRSMCPHCQHTLAWYDLLPVVSWLSLGGKCRYCHRSISWQYPLVELTTAALFIASYLFWPLPITYNLEPITSFAVWLISLVMLMALMVYDIRWMLLPNKIVFPLTGVAAIGALLRIVAADQPLHAFVLTVAAVAIAGGIFYVLFQISGGKWIGGGDVKLGFALGLLLGKPELAFLMLFVASLLGLVVSLPAVIAKKNTMASKVPFGPFLIVAMVFVQLFGTQIIDWYAATFLYL